MKLIFQTKRLEAIRIDLGFETPFHSSKYWLTIAKEYYNEKGEVTYGEWILGFWKR